MKMKCLARGHNTAPLVRFEPTTLRSRVRHSTELSVLQAWCVLDLVGNHEDGFSPDPAHLAICLCWTWLGTMKTGFLMTRLIYWTNSWCKNLEVFQILKIHIFLFFFYFTSSSIFRVYMMEMAL